MQNKERGAVSWLMEFAGEKRIFYIVSVIAAIIGGSVFICKRYCYTID